MTPDEMKRLMLGLHRSIEQQSEAVAAKITAQAPRTPAYPPNGGLTDEEQAALKALEPDPALHSGLRKLIAGATAAVVFELFNFIDGTGAPAGEQPWGAFHIDKMSKDEARRQVFLHDTFYETYWDWRKVRPDPGWRLDVLKDDE
jgi:hypothetical protein